MPNPNKRKGRDAEIAVARFLVENGYPYAEATRRSGWADDRGDIDGVPGVVFEVKNRKAWDVAGWCGELDVEIENAWAETGLVVVKKRGTRDVGEWYGIAPMRLMVPLLRSFTD